MKTTATAQRSTTYFAAASSDDARAQAYLPFFQTGSDLQIDEWPAQIAYDHWLALGFVAGAYAEIEGPGKFPEPAIGPTQRFYADQFLSGGLDFYPRLLSVISSWADAATKGRIYPGKLTVVLNMIDSGRIHARQASAEQRNKIRFYIRHFQQLANRPHPSQRDSLDWPFALCLPVWGILLARSLADPVEAVALPPLIRASHIRYRLQNAEREFFEGFYRTSPLDLSNTAEEWIRLAVEHVRNMIEIDPQSVHRLLNVLTNAELENEWATICDELPANQEITVPSLLEGARSRLQEDHGLSLEWRTPFVCVDQAVHAVDFVVWRLALDAFWTGEI